MFKLRYLFLLLFASGLQAQPWPRFQAPLKLSLYKTAGFEMTDTRWVHLHHGNHHVADATSATVDIKVYADSIYNEQTQASTGVQVRYTVRGVPISDWLNPPWAFTIDINDPDLAGVPDGVSALSVEARNPGVENVQPVPMFIHITRGEPDEIDETVPLITGDDQDATVLSYGPSIRYIHPKDRRWDGYPCSSTVTAWSQPVDDPAADLYLEQFGAHTPLFLPVNMWWDHVAHPGHSYLRGLPPKYGEDHRNLFDVQTRLPYKDGPRGINWVSAYISGQVSSKGIFYFAEVGGRIGWLRPDGSVLTIAGWRTQVGKDPIWIKKPVATVRRNQELRGRWVDGIRPGETGGFHTPLDVAIDPKDDRICYVAGWGDHCIWRVQLPDLSGEAATVSVFAGDPAHTAGYVDATGSAARFNGPSSLVFDPVADCIYVSDQDNDAVRRISRAGVVTTLAGKPGMAGRLRSAGASDVFAQADCRSRSQFAVTAAEAAAGVKADVYVPQCVRVDSKGRVILLELGFGSIRRIDPTTGETKLLSDVYQKFREWDRGWAWIDVDRWGNSGPLDGIYWCKFVSTRDSEPFNEVYGWFPPEGGQTKWVFDVNNYFLELWGDHWGPRNRTNPPHYAWLVAVDPRGALFVAGAGEHGICRLRKRTPADPMPGDFQQQYDYYDQGGSYTWLTGGPRTWANTYAGDSLALLTGCQAHNYMGMPDAWALRPTDTDDAILEGLMVPQILRSDATTRRDLLYYLRRQISPVTPLTYEVWREAQGFVGAAGDMLADPDNDGRPNLLEYLQRSNPSYDGADPEAPQLSLAMVGGQQRLVLEFTVSKRPSDAILQVEVSTDLVNWTKLWDSVSGPTTNVLQETDLGPTRRMRVHGNAVTNATSTTREFLRLRGVKK